MIRIRITLSNAKYIPQPPPPSAAYSYNSDGIRTKKTVGSAATEYMLNGSQILAEQTGSTMIKYFYDSDGKRASFKTGNKYYFYVYNLQGDVTHIVDTDGNVVATYEYDPYGKILNLDSLTAIGKVNPFRYRGYYYDSESNLYYLNSRYYNPEIGRFINADDHSLVTATPGANTDKNLFTYCDNNPIVRADDEGDIWHVLIGGALGAVSGVVSTLASNCLLGKTWSEGLGMAAFTGAVSGALASTGAGTVCLFAVNMALGIIEETADQYSKNDGFHNLDTYSIARKGVIEGVFGVLGGSNGSSKYLGSLAKQTAKRTHNELAHNGLKAGAREAKKAFSFYGRTTKNYYKKTLKDSFFDTIVSTIKNLFT